jgi:hypothetical protein
MKKIILLIFCAAIICKTTKSFAHINVTDSLALVDLYNNTGGPNWPSKCQWTLTNPVNTWPQVGLSSGRVVTLFYPGGLFMKGIIPVSLGNLTALTELYLGDSLSGTLPSSLDNLPLLTHLDLSDNGFTFAGMEGMVKAYNKISFGYSSQNQISLHLNGNTFSVSAGGTLANNTYRWTKYKTNKDITITGDSTFTPAFTGTYYVTVTNSICTQLTLTSNALSISELPVKLSNFNGSLIKNNVRLRWETAIETGSSYFNVQRSINGIDFSNIGKVNAAGNSKGEQHYAYTDADIAVQGVSAVYYRLGEVDKDGINMFSNIFPIKINALSNEISIYPNPAKDVVYLKVNNGYGQISIVLIDTKGQQLEHLNQSVQNSNIISINTTKLVKGIYFIYLTVNGNDTVQEFIKK